MRFVAGMWNQKGASMAECGSMESTVWQTSARPSPATVQQLAEAAIMALTEWNAAALDLLAQQASSWIENPPAVHALAASASQHRLLGALLQETERNLRIFRETSPCVEFQPKTGVYESRWS